MNKMKSKINLTNVIAYLQGNLRYYLYYSRFKFLIRAHIREQIDFRIRFMKKECYENGSCVICGCATTALQMANKQCDAPCYPPMMNKVDWRDFVKGYYTWRDKSHTDYFTYIPHKDHLKYTKYFKGKVKNPLIPKLSRLIPPQNQL